jgi:sugar lactone lactonase YvrE
MCVNPSTREVYILDWNNHRVRTVTPDGRRITTLIGTDLLGDEPLSATDPAVPAGEANLNHPTDVALDPQGTLILAAWHNQKIKMLDAAGLLGVLAGTTQGFAGDGGPAVNAQLNLPSSVAYDGAGNLYISDQGNQRIRKVETDGTISTFAGTGTAGFGGDGGPATEAMFNLPKGSNAEPAGKLAISPEEATLYIADTMNHRVRVIDLTTGIIRTVAGTGTPGYSGDGGPATDARLTAPADVAVGPDRSVYIADVENHAIRRVDPSGSIVTVAGTGTPGFSGDGGPAVRAHLNRPGGVFVEGNLLYIADTYNHRIRRVVLPSGER